MWVAAAVPFHVKLEKKLTMKKKVRAA